MNEPVADTLTGRLAGLRDDITPFQQEQQHLLERAQRIERRAAEVGDTGLEQAARAAAAALLAAGAALALAQLALARPLEPPRGEAGPAPSETG